MNRRSWLGGLAHYIYTQTGIKQSTLAPAKAFFILLYGTGLKFLAVFWTLMGGGYEATNRRVYSTEASEAGRQACKGSPCRLHLYEANGFRAEQWAISSQDYLLW
jgi:hypothetical protein